MEKPMTPSIITDSQIGKINELLGARLRKSDLPRDAVQEVLEHQGKELLDEFESTLRQRVEAVVYRNTVFIPLTEFSLLVPEKYCHNTQLTSFAERFRSEFYYFNDAITDQNFGKATIQLTPGQKLQAKIFGIKSGMRVSSVQCLDFLRSQKVILVGAQGLSLVYELDKGKLPKGKWTVSFDKKDALWVDGDGCHRVPCIDARSDGGFRFDLGSFGNGWYDDYGLLCLCDESA